MLSLLFFNFKVVSSISNNKFVLFRGKYFNLFYKNLKLHLYRIKWNISNAKIPIIKKVNGRLLGKQNKYNLFLVNKSLNAAAPHLNVSLALMVTPTFFQNLACSSLLRLKHHPPPFPPLQFYNTWMFFLLLSLSNRDWRRCSHDPACWGAQLVCESLLLCEGNKLPMTTEISSMEQRRGRSWILPTQPWSKLVGGTGFFSFQFYFFFTCYSRPIN